MKQAVVYLRVSTSKQIRDGLSMEAQEAKARAWAAANDIATVIVKRDDGVSGGSMDARTGLHEAIAVASRGDVLIVYSLSRLARSTKDTIAIAEQLEKRGIDLCSLTEKIDTTTSAGKMVFRMLAVLAEFEKDQISDRTTNAMSHLRSINRRTSRHPPYGFHFIPAGHKPNTTPPVPIFATEPDIGEQTVILLATELHGRGLSLNAVARRMAEVGIFSRAGTPFAPSAVNAMIVGAK